METPAAVNISEVIDNSRLGPFQLGICILCGLCLIMDGFDVQSMGYVAPAIIREWKIPNAELGPVFGAGLLGVLIGSLLFSMLADKIGRRPVLIGLTLFFSAMTFVTAHAGSVPQMLLIRFIAGLGLGGIMPNAVALCGEYSSRAIRVTVMTIVGNGFTAGAAIGGFISAWLIPNFGWRSVFYFGASIPLVIALAMFFWLPESLQFLVLRGKDLKNVYKWLRRIAPYAEVPSGSVQYVVAEKKRGGVPVLHLFRDGRATGTVLLWIVNFMNLLNLYFLSSWLPTVVRDSGRSTSTAVLAGTAVQVGGAIAALGLGWFVVSFGFVPVLSTCFAVAAVNVAMIGYPGLSLALLFAVVFLAGMGIVGGQAAVNALAATYYPTSLRSTGIGWSLGIGRIGAIVGPVLAGQFMALPIPDPRRHRDDEPGMTMRISEYRKLIITFAACAVLFDKGDAGSVQAQNLSGKPDVHLIVESSIAATQRHWRARLHYTYTERDENRRRDSAGRVTSEDVEVSRTILVNGVPFGQLVERNGRPPSAWEERKQKKELDKLKEETSEERAEGLRKQEEETASIVREVPMAFDFQLVGEEAANGRPAYVIQATPHPGYHAQGKYGSMFPKVAGKLWVDKQDLGWIKVEGQVIHPFSMGLFLVRLLRGSQINMQQTRVDDGIWMPQRVEVQAVAKIFFVKSLSIDRVMAFSDYKLPPIGEPH